MSGSVLFLLFVGGLMIAARIFLRGERRPPILPEDDPTAGFLDQANGSYCRPEPEKAAVSKRPNFSHLKLERCQTLYDESGQTAVQGRSAVGKTVEHHIKRT